MTELHWDRLKRRNFSSSNSDFVPVAVFPFPGRIRAELPAQGRCAWGGYNRVLSVSVSTPACPSVPGAWASFAQVCGWILGRVSLLHPRHAVPRAVKGKQPLGVASARRLCPGNERLMAGGSGFPSSGGRGGSRYGERHPFQGACIIDLGAGCCRRGGGLGRAE